MIFLMVLRITITPVALQFTFPL